LRQHFDSTNRGIALHGNEAQNQFALSIWLQANEFPDYNVGSPSFFDQVEGGEKNLAIAEDVEDMGYLWFAFEDIG
jgi:hypothetical protein